MNATTEAPAVPTAAPGSSLEELLAELLHLSADEKLEVIARLAQSLQAAAALQPIVKAPAKASILDFAGAWADMPGTDEEITASIRSARVFTRPEVSLD